MQNSLMMFVDIAMECQAGITELYSESLGITTFIGFSKEGDAVLQTGDGDNACFTTIPELTWNLTGFVKPFEPETHVRFLSQKSLESLHNETEKFLHIDLASEYGMMYPYEVTMTIKKIN
jgi:hypothetical protein